MSFENIKNIFLNSKNNVNEYYFAKYLFPTPSWEDIINAINYKYNNPEKKIKESKDKRFVIKKTNNEEIETDILIYNKLDLQVWSILNKDVEENIIIGEKFLPQLINFINKFQDITKENKWSIKALINFVGNESKYDAHKDIVDVLSWQCLGSVTYRIYKGIESDIFGMPIDITGREYVDYDLSPGDVIFLPKGVVHEVISKYPRATLIMNFDLK